MPISLSLSLLLSLSLCRSPSISELSDSLNFFIALSGFDAPAYSPSIKAKYPLRAPAKSLSCLFTALDLSLPLALSLYIYIYPVPYTSLYGSVSLFLVL